ncbi:hypothetical protein Lal_00013439 [Lupinus albus]|uniref:Uncharacterized protein n=1 Tax=Lupinus albus TaxID=3870 RepID=A0A6A5LR81_LUPAL|nr:hypothetical protein Lalb_Chr09g0333771 [Lupinus albus]KAF1862678.1 hypothetical protein Lal_00013439 [Lupinus albus]
MACLEMYNSEHKNHHEHHQCPRISFSNDFIDTQQAMKQEHGCSRSDSALLVSSDFEFSVTNYSMMNADELFSKGRLLPFKDNCNNNKMLHKGTTTLREELLVDEDSNFQEFSLRPPKGSSSTRWKGFLGLRKSHIGSKKIDSSEGSSSRLTNEGARINITSQEVLNEGGSNCSHVEIGI